MGRGDIIFRKSGRPVKLAYGGQLGHGPHAFFAFPAVQEIGHIGQTHPEVMKRGRPGGHDTMLFQPCEGHIPMPDLEALA